jgi:hypothetical protein
MPSFHARIEKAPTGVSYERVKGWERTRADTLSYGLALCCAVLQRVYMYTSLPIGLFTCFIHITIRRRFHQIVRHYILKEKVKRDFLHSLRDRAARRLRLNTNGKPSIRSLQTVSS